MILNENYEASRKLLQEMKTEKQVLANLTEHDVALIESLQGTLESEVVTITAPDSDYSLILSDETNKDIFEAVGLIALEILTEGSDEGETQEEGIAENGKTLLTEKHDEPDDDEDEKGKEWKNSDKESEEPEEDEDEDEDKDEEKEKEDEKNESLTAEEAEQVKEALADLLTKNSFIIESEGGKFIINSNSPHFDTIKEQLLATLVSVCEATDELPVVEEFIGMLENLEQGMFVIEAEGAPETHGAPSPETSSTKNKGEPWYKRAKGAVAKKFGQYKGLVTKTWQSGKMGKAKVIGAHAGAAGVVAGGAYGIHKLAKRKKEEAVEPKEKILTEADKKEGKADKVAKAGLVTGAAGAGALGAREVVAAIKAKRALKGISPGQDLKQVFKSQRELAKTGKLAKGLKIGGLAGLTIGTGAIAAAKLAKHMKAKKREEALEVNEEEKKERNNHNWDRALAGGGIATGLAGAGLATHGIRRIAQEIGSKGITHPNDLLRMKGLGRTRAGLGLMAAGGLATGVGATAGGIKAIRDRIRAGRKKK